jgi:hypothetical protein
VNRRAAGVKLLAGVYGKIDVVLGAPLYVTIHTGRYRPDYLVGELQLDPCRNRNVDGCSLVYYEASRAPANAGEPYVAAQVLIARAPPGGAGEVIGDLRDGAGCRWAESDRATAVVAVGGFPHPCCASGHLPGGYYSGWVAHIWGRSWLWSYRGCSGFPGALGWGGGWLLRALGWLDPAATWRLGSRVSLATNGRQGRRLVRFSFGIDGRQDFRLGFTFTLYRAPGRAAAGQGRGAIGGGYAGLGALQQSRYLSAG